MTVVIPTIGNEPSRLLRLLKHLRNANELIKICVVWDGHKPPTTELTKKVQFLYHCKLIVHDSNKGLSAARNTGLDHIYTKLGTFIDDDIFPDPKWYEHVLSFHNKHTNEEEALVGRVTWEKTDFENTLTRWYEEVGGWSIFTSSRSLNQLSNFCGGVTSFKTLFFKNIKFNEGFTRYGCEDIEFGTRFFSNGGSLYLNRELVGRHYKVLTLERYINEHISAGFSKGLLAHLHPDDFFDYSFHKKACEKKEQINFINHLSEIIKYIDCREGGGFNLDYNSFMGVLTNACLLHGYFEFFKLDVFENDEFLLNKNNEKEYIPYALTFFLNEILAENDLESIKVMQKKMPYYFEPFLVESKVIKSKEPITRFLRINSNKTLSNNVKGTINSIKDKNVFSLSESLNARELFKTLMSTQYKLSIREQIDLICQILNKDPTFVSAYLLLLKVKELDEPTKKIIGSVCAHFASMRPEAEKRRHLKELSLLMDQNGEQRIESFTSTD
nr:glycosyltransferase [Alteromonas hispanica]